MSDILNDILKFIAFGLVCLFLMGKLLLAYHDDDWLDVAAYFSVIVTIVMLLGEGA